ncbi:MAG: CRISPR-associated helicase Cas3' [Candidatus Thorarchaeota archaeon]
MAKPHESLFEHTLRTLAVLDSMSCLRWAHEAVGGNDLHECAALALAMHDTGKAAEGFQRAMLQGRGSWGYRHEILSAAMMMVLESPDNDLVRDAALAVLSHHKDLDTLWRDYSTSPRGGVGHSDYLARVTELESNLGDVLTIVERVAASIRGRYHLAADTLASLPRSPSAIMGILTDDTPFWRFLEWFRLLDDDEQLRRRDRYMLLKGIVTTCDHLASAGLSSLRSFPPDTRFISVTPTLAQQWAGRLSGSGILVAPTGSGKTEAALLWMQNNLRSCERVLYVLPTIASINKMYKRLALQLGGGSPDRIDLVSMLHHRSAYFLSSMWADDDDLPSRVNPSHLINISRRIYSPLKVSTPFQPLKTLFGVSGYERGFTEMCGSLVVVDEVHAYDPHVIALIMFMLREMKRLGSRVFVMSATMPKFLRELLYQYADIPAKNLYIDHSWDDRARHVVEVRAGDLLGSVAEIAREMEHDRTLIVCNTVRSAVAVFETLREEYDTSDIVLLHGRFVLRDRIQKEDAIDRASILVSTQAVEVSLDIDFDRLYTEPAPIDALVQRFGRVNRRSRIDGGAPVVIFREGGDYDDRVYRNYERVRSTVRLLSEVCQENRVPVSESVIRELVEQVYAPGLSEDELVEFKSAYVNLQELWQTQMPFRRGSSDEFNQLFDSVEVIPAAFESVVDELATQRRRWDLIEYVASVSRQLFVRMWMLNLVKTARPYPVVEVPYDSDYGLRTDVLSELEGGGDALVL